MRAAKPVLFPSVILPSGDPTNPWIEAMVWNNTVEFQDSFSEGIGIYNTKGPTIWMRPSRELTGNGIGVWSSMLTMTTPSSAQPLGSDTDRSFRSLALALLQPHPLPYDR